MTATCRSCGAEILWATTSLAGMRMPVDPEPTGDGTLVLVRAGSAPIVANRRDDDAGPFYRSHFSTCPDAIGWRRRR